MPAGTASVCEQYPKISPCLQYARAALITGEQNQPASEDGLHRRGGRQESGRREQPPQQDAPQKRVAVPVHTGIHRVPARALLPARAPPRHRHPLHGWNGGVAGRGAAVRAPGRDARRQERHRGRRVHRVLLARHRPRAPQRRQGSASTLQTCLGL